MDTENYFKNIDLIKDFFPKATYIQKSRVIVYFHIATLCMELIATGLEPVIYLNSEGFKRWMESDMQFLFEHPEMIYFNKYPDKKVASMNFYNLEISIFIEPKILSTYAIAGYNGIITEGNGSATPIIIGDLSKDTFFYSCI